MILCCGDALIDMIPERMVTGGDGYVPRCGGAALNTAMALARQGAVVGLLTGMSRDRFGQQLDAALASAGVDRALIVISARPTTLAFVHLGGDEATYTFHDENSAGRMLLPEDLPALPDHVRAMLLGGISLCHAPAADAYEALAGRAGGRLVMLDPNIRPGIIGDEKGYRQRLQRMMARAHVVKLSQADLDWIDPRDVAWRDKLSAVLEAGPSLVLFTRGARGVSARHRDGRELVVAAHKLRVADTGGETGGNTVGAGDAFNAGFLAALAQMGLLGPAAIETIQTDALRDCLERATGAAAAALSRAGGA